MSGNGNPVESAGAPSNSGTGGFDLLRRATQAMMSRYVGHDDRFLFSCPNKSLTSSGCNLLVPARCLCSFYYHFILRLPGLLRDFQKLGGASSQPLFPISLPLDPASLTSSKLVVTHKCGLNVVRRHDLDTPGPKLVP
jgi:hypothetical protein